VPGEQLKRFIVNSHPDAATIDVTVVVYYFLERASIDHCLIAFKARPLFPFISDNGYRPKFDTVDCLPRILCTFGDLDAIEAGVFKRF